MDARRYLLRKNGLSEDEIDRLIGPETSDGPLSMAGAQAAEAPLSLRAGPPMSMPSASVLAPQAPPPPMPMRRQEPSIRPLSMAGGKPEIAPLSMAGPRSLMDEPQAPRQQVATAPGASTAPPTNLPPFEDRKSLFDIIRAKLASPYRAPMERPQPRAAAPMVGPPMPAPQATMTAAIPGSGPQLLMPEAEAEEEMPKRRSVLEPRTVGGEEFPFRQPTERVWNGQEGREPWQVSAAEEGFQEKRNNLQNWRDVSEGLGNMQLTSGAEIRSGVGPRPFQAEGLREKQAEYADKVSPQEAEFYRTQGYNVPVGMSRTAALKSVPALSGLGYRREALELARQRLDAMGDKEEGIQRRYDKSLNLRERQYTTSKERAERPSETSARDVADFDNALGLLDQVIAEKSSYNTGPYRDLWESVKKYTVGEDAQYAAFRQKVLTELNSYINNMTGKQMSGPEATRLINAMPTTYDNDAVFMSKAQTAKQILGGYRENYLGAIEGTGRNVAGLRGAAPSAPPTTPEAPQQAPLAPPGSAPQMTGAGGKIRVRLKVDIPPYKAGQTLRMDADKFDESKFERI